MKRTVANTLTRRLEADDWKGWDGTYVKGPWTITVERDGRWWLRNIGAISYCGYGIRELKALGRTNCLSWIETL